MDKQEVIIWTRKVDGDEWADPMLGDPAAIVYVLNVTIENHTQQAFLALTKNAQNVEQEWQEPSQ